MLEDQVAMLASDFLFLEFLTGEAYSPLAFLGEAAIGTYAEFYVHARLGYSHGFPDYALGSPLRWPQCSLPCHCTSCHTSPCRAALVRVLDKTKPKQTKSLNFPLSGFLESISRSKLQSGLET